MNKKQSPVNWYDESIKVDPFQRFWHKKRFTEVSRIINPVKGKVLDIGCNDGTFSKIIFERTKANKLIGIDVLQTSVDWANKHWKNPRMKFIVGDAHNLKFPGGYFDAVFA